MRDSENFLLETLGQLSKKADRYIFGLIIALLYVVVSLVNKKYELSVDIIGIRIDNPITYHIVVTFVLFVLAGVSGLSIMNYLTKRFSYEKLVLDSSESDKVVKYELLPNNLYEFVYDVFIGQYVRLKLFSDAGRKVAVFGLLLVALIAFALILFSSSIMGWFIDDSIVGYWIFRILFPILFAGLILIFLRSFKQTIRRRKKEIILLKAKFQKEYIEPAK